MESDWGEVESRASRITPKEAASVAQANKPFRNDLERIKRALVGYTEALRQEACHIASACEAPFGSVDVERQMERFSKRLDKLDGQVETHLRRNKHHSTANTGSAVMHK
ncbi:expressed conserved protein [Echinococcus multilocularis]|uniref:Expressed conserved protein n=1 Tax=Echinococcus multilocularis TaxID=6211 RepID=A0A068Y978_ECHMU|nr:expressed conserved protein [Echinococcus multilocularis]